MASSPPSATKETLEVIIIDQLEDIKNLTSENTKLFERIKDLEIQIDALKRQVGPDVKSAIASLHTIENRMERILGTLDTPSTTRREIIESIVRAHEKKMAIDSSDLPAIGKPVVTTTPGFSS